MNCGFSRQSAASSRNPKPPPSPLGGGAFTPVRYSFLPHIIEPEIIHSFDE